MANDSVLFDVRDGVAIIRLNHPATMNALTPEIEWDLCGKLDRAEREADAILLTATGRGFCSGGNLTPGGPMDKAPGERDLGLGIEQNVNPMVMRLRGLSIPLVTAVNGAAAGAGCALALMGDFILAAEEAFFVMTFSRIGLIADGGLTALLPRAIGRVRAMELLMLGDRLSAATALDWGMINRVVPGASLEDEAMTIARRLADGATLSLGLMRDLVWQGCEEPLESHLARERRVQRIAGKCSDFDEGDAAFHFFF